MPLQAFNDTNQPSRFDNLTITVEGNHFQFVSGVGGVLR